MMSLLLARTIAGYQRHLSPLKGFSCAHRVLHGGVSCSAYAKRVVLRCGCGKFLPLMRRRFARCAEAARVLQSGRAGKPVLDYAKPEKAKEPTGRHGAGAVGDCSGCARDVGKDVLGQAACELACSGIAEG